MNKVSFYNEFKNQLHADLETVKSENKKDVFLAESAEMSTKQVLI